MTQIFFPKFGWVDDFMMILWWFYDGFMMILWWFMLVTSRKPTNMSIATLNFAIWEVQIQIRTLCRTCKRKVGCCGRCLLMKIGMNDRWVHSFETSPDVVPDFDWLCRCDLKIFQGACKRRCGDSQHSRKSHWRPPHHWKRQGHGFNAVPTKCLCLVVSTCHLFGPSALSDSCWVPCCLKPAQLVCSQHPEHPDLDPWT